MLPVDVAGVFFLAAMALALAPGPDNIFVLTQSALHGPRAGLLVTLGLTTGILGHTLAVTMGVAALLQASPLAFGGLKIVGAAYLLYLAWQAFRARASNVAESRGEGTESRRMYVRGVIMNATNPKVAIFFLAFLPQFADPARGPIAGQLIQLGALFMLATLLVFGSIAWAAGRIGEWLKRSTRAQVTMNRLAGVVFLGLAAKLAMASR